MNERYAEITVTRAVLTVFWTEYEADGNNTTTHQINKSHWMTLDLMHDNDRDSYLIVCAPMSYKSILYPASTHQGVNDSGSNDLIIKRFHLT